jgi:copper chaperone CopZ
MLHTFRVKGMTCNGCENSITKIFSSIAGVKNAQASKDSGTVTFEAERKVNIEEIAALLPAKYTIERDAEENRLNATKIELKSWFDSYKPIFLVFVYLSIVSTLASFQTYEAKKFYVWMNYFMAGFFIVFSFFKLLNLEGFTESYAMYDVVAKRWKFWGYLYAFIELFLGLAYLSGFKPIITNWVTLIVMTISLIGVTQSVINKRKIKCACLGVVFDLPMSTITIIEDLMMVLMSAFMLFTLYK